ncbi:MAG TPA: ATP citrate lyase citrate-binding domain-containing protein [Candidatus Saccharimonadia bacterium]|nr:ATP citrate lyase citrate-binding domain-containing protein [Candidatus Saccharimonadia bacterium]
MPRKKISEFRAKTILYDALGQAYDGLSVDTEAKDWHSVVKRLSGSCKYVVKVDEGIKGRFKKGLVFLDRQRDELEKDVEALRKKGFRYVLIEPFKLHDQASEQYLSIERLRDGNKAAYSKLGGVDVESKAAAMAHELLGQRASAKITQALGLPAETAAILNDTFNKNYFAFLEINPLVVTEDGVQLLDAAVEVDDEAAPLVHERWTPADIREAAARTPEEVAVDTLASQSQASFRLKVLNENGAVFLLLSGGGASIVVADEVAARGHGAGLANYGEYSGNPNEEETYLYTRQVISLLLSSGAKRKVLIISGAVANFTDIRVTFRGVIRALDESAAQLKRQHVKVFVRRGGPYEREGLKEIAAFLKEKNLYGRVSGPDMTLTDIVPAALLTIEDGK